MLLSSLALPYVTNAKEQAPYRMYFAKQWQQTYFITVHNFLSLAFHQMGLPALYAFSARTTGNNNNNTEDQQSIAQVGADVYYYDHNECIFN